MSKGKYEGAEKRKYVRLDPVRPIQVEYRVVSSKGKKKAEEVRAVSLAGGRAKEGKPRNVSGGGIFLEVGKVSPKTLEALLLGRKFLDMRMRMMGVDRSLRALARVMWVEGQGKVTPGGYGMGVKFVSIRKDDRDKIIDHVIDQHLRGEAE